MWPGDFHENCKFQGNDIQYNLWKTKRRRKINCYGSRFIVFILKKDRIQTLRTSQEMGTICNTGKQRRALLNKGLFINAVIP